ncbi:hypothetical protein Q5P01_025984 [Channa striata]|uniref:Uncharacterized protein n=1 Tax=Channa striata TaxID=64152 RepID=A0AA88ILQ9_CHASR|nr:hypothetical protein Q5P01_025984 [Channa striata]
MGDKRSEETKDHTEESGRDPGVAKPSRQILVVFTDMEKGEEDVDPRNPLNMMENSSFVPQDVKVATNRTCTSEDLPKSDFPAPPPAKPPIKPAQLLSAMNAGIEEEKERRKQEEEQCRYEDTLDKGRKEYEGDVSEDSRDATLTSPVLTKMSSQIEELSRGGQRLSLMPQCSNSPKPVNTAENQSRCLQSQPPGTQHSNKANGQFNLVPFPEEVPHQVSPTETDSNVVTLKWTENKDIQISRQVISKVSSGCQMDKDVFRTEPDPCQLTLKRCENTQEIGETVLDGDLKQTNQKPNARMKLRNLARKVMCKMKEGREEKRRMKARILGRIDNEQDARKEDEMKEEDEEERGRDEDGVTEPLDRIKKYETTSGSLFGSFKVY